ncbi:MAG: hypothetical protein K0R60_1118, partial [Microbacterium sp.]|nr:hypothetical protein [Microbacterium sp.]
GDASAGVVASVPYASPEQLSGAPVTEASDVYQVGATLYFALTGRPPFEGATDVVVRAHLTAPPPLPSVVRRDVERTMDRLVATAPRRHRGDRAGRGSCGDVGGHDVRGDRGSGCGGRRGR